MKRKYFKDGNPEIYNFFTDVELKDFTPKDRAKWTPYSEAELAPIPEEVIKFNEAQKEPCCKEDSKCKKLEAENAELREQLDLLIESSEVLKKSPKEIGDDLLQGPTENVEKLSGVIEEPKNELALDPEQERILLLEECRMKGIKVTHNMKLETLKKKLADANNSE